MNGPRWEQDGSSHCLLALSRPQARRLKPPRFAAMGLDLDPRPKEGHRCRQRLAVSFVEQPVRPIYPDDLT